MLTIQSFLRGRSAAVAAACVLLATAPHQPLAAADYTRYHSYDDMTAALRELVKTHSTLARLVEVAKTREGRVVWAIEIANSAGTPVAERPALLIAANFEGDQLIGSALSVFVAEALLTGYASNPTIKQRLDSHAFYILPRVNPDGAELMFAALKTGRKTNGTRFDNDNDGRVDEDGPEDLNKDGVISMMRVKDPQGPYMIHPDDARLMRRADAQRGEAGGYAVYWEGTDNDGDGFYNEDGAGGIDLNRNFQHKYPYYQPDAGPHMLSEAESRGVMDYVLQRRNVAAILTFGESDNLIAAPTRRGELSPAATLDLIAFANESVAPARQVGVFRGPAAQFFGGRGGGGGDDDAAGGRGAAGGGRGQPRPTPPATTVRYQRRRVLPHDQRSLPPADRDSQRAADPHARRRILRLRLLPVRRSLVLDAGVGHRAGSRRIDPARGTPAGGAPGLPPTHQRPRPPKAARRPARRRASAAFDLRFARWLDGEKIDGFVAWQPFKHPTLGDVEIGGFRPYAVSNPPASKIAELGKSHIEFVTYLTSLFPKVVIANTAVTSHGGGLYRIKAGDREQRLPSHLHGAGRPSRGR